MQSPVKACRALHALKGRDQSAGAQLATVVGVGVAWGGWGVGGERCVCVGGVRNPLLPAQLGGLRMVPVPWLTPSKPGADVLIPLHTRITPPPHHLQPSLDPAAKTKHSGDTSYHKSTHPLPLIWYLWYLSSSASLGLFLGFPDDLGTEMTPSLSMLRRPFCRRGVFFK